MCLNQDLTLERSGHYLNENIENNQCLFFLILLATGAIDFSELYLYYAVWWKCRIQIFRQCASTPPYLTLSFLPSFLSFFRITNFLVLKLEPETLASNSGYEAASTVQLYNCRTVHLYIVQHCTVVKETDLHLSTS